MDETPCYRHGVLAWLWVMVNGTVAFFSVKAIRSKAAFEELIGHWSGILVSDGYGAYRKWVELRQTCLAHLIRRAKELSERTDSVIAHFGDRISTAVGRLIHWVHAPPTKGEVATWYARMCHLINQHRGRKDEAGRFARHLDAEMGNLWVFLLEEGVVPTNNRAERALRFAVLWLRMMQGSYNENRVAGSNGYSPCGRPAASEVFQHSPFSLGLLPPRSKIRLRMSHGSRIPPEQLPSRVFPGGSRFTTYQVWPSAWLFVTIGLEHQGRRRLLWAKGS